MPGVRHGRRALHIDFNDVKLLTMTIDARLQFADLARLPDEEIDLDRAALLIARETDETVDVDFYLGFLDQLADNFERGSTATAAPASLCPASSTSFTGKRVSPAT